MNDRTVRLGLLAVVVVVAVVAVVGSVLLTGRETPSPTPTLPRWPASLTPPSDAAHGAPVRNGLLDPGTYTYGDVQGRGFNVRFTVPAGWTWNGRYLSKGDAAAPDAAAVYFFGGPVHVYADPCHWAEAQSHLPAGLYAAHDLVAALADQRMRSATTPEYRPADSQDVANNWVGWTVELTVPDDVDFADCDRGQFRSWGPDDNARVHQGPGQRDLVWVVDPDHRSMPMTGPKISPTASTGPWGGLIIDAATFPRTPATVISEIEAILRSIRVGRWDVTPAQTDPGTLVPGTLVLTLISEPDRNYDVYLVRSDGAGFRRLTAGPGNEEQARWSPDGTRVVYAASEPERSSIWVMNADGSGKSYLGDGTSPSWSPDGKRILFERSDGNGLSVMNADGSGRRDVGLPYSAHYATWAPNGKIVFVRLRQPSSDHVDSGDLRGNYPGGDLYAVDPDGNGLERLTKGAGLILPSVSPDGSTIAAYATTTDRLLAVPYGADGPAVVLLDRASHYFPNGGRPLAHWTPDGKKLVLGSSDFGEDGGAGLFLVNADGFGLTRIPGLTHVIGPDWRPE